MLRCNQFLSKSEQQRFEEIQNRAFGKYQNPLNFEAAAEPFDATVTVSLDGEHFAESGGSTYRYESAAGKKK